MADRAISALTSASVLTNSDLFVLSQSNQAKSATWQLIISYLSTALAGHGGISTIAKTGTSGLTDTYTITFADSTTSTFTLKNGKGISSATQYYAVSSSNNSQPSTWYTTMQTMTTVNKYLWSYIKYTYNDSTTSSTTPSVIGVYGDTGQASYIHIKYSGSQPTSDADMGSQPDAWIGIYSGTSSSAPAHYTDYDWYEIKGAKGDTGAASSISSQSVTYQSGTSGTVVPSGTWTPTVPTVAQGGYLWTKTALSFNDGTNVTSYSVARMGLDGTGSVVSVNNVSPDGNGNIAITASDIGTSDNNSVQYTLNSIDSEIGSTALPTTAQTLTGAIAEHESDITAINSDIGNTALPTTAQTLTGAIAEHETDISGITSKIGNSVMTTTAQTLTGAVNELNTAAGLDRGNATISSADQIKNLDTGTYRIAGASTTIFPAGYGLLEILKSNIYSVALFYPVNNTASASIYRRSWNNSSSSWYEADWVGIDSLPVPVAQGGTGATTVANARNNLDMCYAANDTMSITSSAVLNGYFISTSQAYFDFVVEKSMENISSISVTAMSGTLQGSNGAVEGGSNVNFYSGSAYTLTCTKQGNKHVRISLKKSSAMSNAVAATTACYFGTLTLKFT